MSDQITAPAQEQTVPFRRGRQTAKGSAELATVSQAAELLGVSQMTIRRAIYDGEIPVLKFRGRYHVPRRFLAGMLDDANRGQQVEVAERCAAWQANAVGGAAS